MATIIQDLQHNLERLADCQDIPAPFYSFAELEPRRWVIRCNDYIVLSATSKRQLLDVLIAYVRGYNQALDDADPGFFR